MGHTPTQHGKQETTLDVQSGYFMPTDEVSMLCASHHGTPHQCLHTTHLQALPTGMEHTRGYVLEGRVNPQRLVRNRTTQYV